jgi:hypothetical protein
MPSLVGNASASPRFRLVVSLRNGGFDNPLLPGIESLERKGEGHSGIWLKVSQAKPGEALLIRREAPC